MPSGIWPAAHASFWKPKMRNYLKDRLTVIPIILTVLGGWVLLSMIGYSINVAIPSVLLILIWLGLLLYTKRL